MRSGSRYIFLRTIKPLLGGIERSQHATVCSEKRCKGRDKKKEPHERDSNSDTFRQKLRQSAVFRGFVRGQIPTLFGVHPVTCFTKIIVGKDVFRGRKLIDQFCFARIRKLPNMNISAGICQHDPATGICFSGSVLDSLHEILSAYILGIIIRTKERGVNRRDILGFRLFFCGFILHESADEIGYIGIGSIDGDGLTMVIVCTDVIDVIFGHVKILLLKKHR